MGDILLPVGTSPGELSGLPAPSSLIVTHFQITDWVARAGTLPKATRVGHFLEGTPITTVQVDLTTADFALGDLYLIYQFNGLGSDGLALDNFSITAIPEPTTPILLLSGALGTFRRKRRCQEAAFDGSLTMPDDRPALTVQLSFRMFHGSISVEGKVFQPGMESF